MLQCVTASPRCSSGNACLLCRDVIRQVKEERQLFGHPGSGVDVGQTCSDSGDGILIWARPLECEIRGSVKSVVKKRIGVRCTPRAICGSTESVGGVHRRRLSPLSGLRSLSAFICVHLRFCYIRGLRGEDARVNNGRANDDSPLRRCGNDKDEAVSRGFRLEIGVICGRKSSCQFSVAGGRWA